MIKNVAKASVPASQRPCWPINSCDAICLLPKIDPLCNPQPTPVDRPNALPLETPRATASAVVLTVAVTLPDAWLLAVDLASRCAFAVDAGREESAPAWSAGSSRPVPGLRPEGRHPSWWLRRWKVTNEQSPWWLPRRLIADDSLATLAGPNGTSHALCQSNYQTDESLEYSRP